MKTYKCKLIIAITLCSQLLSCQTDTTVALREALTFHASFDQGVTADFSLGDSNMYTATGSYVDMVRQLADVAPGMNVPHHHLVKDNGRFGGALEFGKQRSNQVIFYKSENNVAYNAENWSGSISFWLSVDPSTDLKGYTDPIQLTDVNFNDASLWVDFTDETPPSFRLGVIGDKAAWSQDTITSSSQETFERRIIKVEKPQFSREQWTHILITYKGLGTAQSKAQLYLNGEKQGTVSGIDDPFSWDIEKSNIFLGLGFTGLMDDLSIFNRSLTEEEVQQVYQLENGIHSVL
ncbi:hypothetical protein BFP97_03075 [Roseivirga sp. 4D4]|uniref:LamG-like jellyroll fold domain-containing protein n=1 Tax=Roseivirga sp. 4D4 TaxID=1889784 RepID=UPI000852C429|nr:LamG-like jellyroll fold domain-containing protein [Roseivirga sp. 4D4]OEK00549.1 hypothetical protein BFP97_03075 [Roseivirga sp. 4D4]